MALVRIATIKSRIKGHHVNNYDYRIGEELQCKLETKNKYSDHAILVLAKKNGKKTKGKACKKSDEWTTVGHVPDAFAEVLFPLMKTWKLYLVKAIVSENHRVAPEGKWVPGGGIEILCSFELYGPKIYKKCIRNMIKDCEC